MKAIRISEANFSNSESIDFTKNKKLAFIINLLAILSFPVFYLIFFYLSELFSINSSDDLLYYWASFKKLPATDALIFVIVILLVFVIHELIHGLCFYLFTGEKPVYGFKTVYLYAGAPNWYLKKRYYLVVSLCPFAVITALGIIIIVFVPTYFSPAVFILIITHAAGCIGDIWMSVKLSGKPKTTYVNDCGTSFVISY